MTSVSSPPEAPQVTPLRRAPAQLLRVTTTPGMLRLPIIGLVALCLAREAVAAWMVSQRASAASDVAATTDATAWYAAHQRVRSLDGSGAHSKAVLPATGPGPGDSGTYHFGYLNPLNGQIEGIDIDMVHAVAAAIFGNPGKVQFKAITDAQRIPDIQSGAVDMVAHTMTIDCSRLKLVDFSTVYFDAGQRVLKGSPVHRVGAPVPAPPLASCRG